MIRPSQPFRSILVYGMGMMGSSLALAVRKVSPHTRICGVVRSEKSASYLNSQKIVDEVLVSHNTATASRLPYTSYELIVFALPIRQILLLVDNIPVTQALITDLSSTQGEIQRAFEKRSELRFVNSHPLCGSEKSGPEAAIPSLFESKLCLLSDDPRREKELCLLEDFWHSIGMLTCKVNPNQHDQALAFLSHGPHLISSLLCYCAQANPAVRSLLSKTSIKPTGGGFQGMARIAGSNPKMWMDILATNTENLSAFLDSFAKEMEALALALRQAKPPSYWLDWFQMARKARDKLCNFPR